MKLKLKKILAGLGLIAIGLVFGYFFIYLKVVDMQNHVPELRYSLKVMILVPLCFVFGLYYVLFQPSGTGKWADLEPREKPAFIVALISFAIATGLLYYWFDSQLKLYGYA
ncbi:MAG: hypothetical protein FIA97_07750 [Methylococcaceae bacterium]|nr:hypothetical protein [Methylococcaceae bacterium]